MLKSNRSDSMRLKIIINQGEEDEIVIRAREKTPLIEAIEKLVSESEVDIIGYSDKEAVKLDVSAICRFSVDNGKVVAYTLSGRYKVRQRLFQLEEKLPDSFIKINQSCLANIRMIERFDASFSGSLLVKFKDGSSDYVSRRQMKSVKERIGI